MISRIRAALAHRWGPAVWTAADIDVLATLGIAFDGPVKRPAKRP